MQYRQQYHHSNARHHRPCCVGKVNNNRPASVVNCRNIDFLPPRNGHIIHVYPNESNSEIRPAAAFFSGPHLQHPTWDQKPFDFITLARSPSLGPKVQNDESGSGSMNTNKIQPIRLKEADEEAHGDDNPASKTQAKTQRVYIPDPSSTRRGADQPIHGNRPPSPLAPSFLANPEDTLLLRSGKVECAMARPEIPTAVALCDPSPRLTMLPRKLQPLSATYRAFPIPGTGTGTRGRFIVLTTRTYAIPHQAAAFASVPAPPSPMTTMKAEAPIKKKPASKKHKIHAKKNQVVAKLA